MSYTRAASRAALRRVQTNVASKSLSSFVGRPLAVSATSSVSTSSSRVTAIRSTRLIHTASPLHAGSAAAASAAPGSVIDFNLADIGEGIAECEVLQWFVAPGDTVNQFDKICEVQSDKANVEITSRYDGVVKELKYKIGDLAKVGAPLISIQLAGPAAGATEPASVPIPPKPAAAAAPSAPAPAAAPSDLGADAALHARNEKVLTSPAVRRIAREEKVDLSLVRGTGPAGRILKEDVLAYIKGGRVATAPKPSSTIPAPPTPSADAIAAAQTSGAAPAAAKPKVIQTMPEYSVEDKEVPISGLNRVMVQTMTAANQVPHLGYADEICLDSLVTVRAALNKQAEKYGVKLSYMPFIIKACSLALKHYPQLNAHTNADCSSLTHRAHHNIGLAMDTPRGLLVPNIKDVANKSLLEIGREMARLAALGREGKLGREDLQGGTFTLSNVGTIGGTYLNPILVVPEVVIGAIGKIQTLPRFDEAMNVKPTKIITFSWSADHRVVDGATIARFSNQMKYYLENPEIMLLETK